MLSALDSFYRLEDFHQLRIPLGVHLCLGTPQPAFVDPAESPRHEQVCADSDKPEPDPGDPGHVDAPDSDCRETGNEGSDEFNSALDQQSDANDALGGGRFYFLWREFHPVAVT